MPKGDGQYVIDLHHVQKTYRGKVQALRGVEMRVHPGEIFGLLGPNGAGKSTLVKIMMTVVRAGRADGTLLGRHIGHKPTLARIGYLPEHHRLPGYLTGRQALRYYAALARVSRRDRATRAGSMLERVGMAEWGDRRISTYSKGMQQRVGLAQALMNDPELVLLDEPTDGVDPMGRREIRDVLIELRRQGRTVFLNSHLLSELEMVCDRVAIMVQGMVAMQGTIEDLTRHSQRYEIVVEGEPPPWAQADPALTVRREDRREDQPVRATIVAGGAEPGPIQPLLDRLRGEGRVICAVRPVRETLEDLFMRAVRDPETGRTRGVGAARAGAGGPGRTGGATPT